MYYYYKFKLFFLDSHLIFKKSLFELTKNFNARENIRNNFMLEENYHKESIGRKFLDQRFYFTISITKDNEKFLR